MITNIHRLDILENVLNELNLCKLFKTQIVFVESARRVKTFTICKKTDETNNFRCDNCAVAWIGTEIFTDWIYRRSVLNKRLQIRRAFGIFEWSE